MLNCRDAHIVFRQDSAALRVDNILGDSIHDGLIIQIDALNLVTCIFRGWIECDCKTQPCVQTFATKRETTFQCILFQHNFSRIYFFSNSSIRFCRASICLYISGNLRNIACDLK